MKKALIIGICGFAGSALRTELINNGYDVYGADVVSGDDRVRKVDMLDVASCDALISDIRPDIIFNLAGQASPQISWKDINLTNHLNVDLSVNIVNSCIKNELIKTRMVFIGSANQYDLTKCDGLVSESTPLVDNSPYAVSKNTQEAILKLMANKYDLDIVFTRSFNHIGPNQKVGFVITDYCSRIAQIESGKLDTFTCGNLDSWRDFSDVRDVVRAYRLIGESGRSGEIYNVGSGRSYYIRDLIGELVNMSPEAAKVVNMPARLDDSKLVHYMADISKLSNDTGFEPVYDVFDTIKAVLEAFREKERAV